MLWFILGIFFASSVLTVVNANCEIDPNSQDPGPLVLLPGSAEFNYPTYGDSTLKFNRNVVVQFSCPGGFVRLGNTQSTTVVQGTCVTGVNFLINGQTVSWRQITCTRVPWSTSRYTGRQCPEGGREAEVGFNVGDGRFLRTMQICYDDVNQNVIYSHYTLTATINERRSGTPRPGWLQGSFFSVGSDSVDTLYTRNRQRQTINALLGLNSSSTKYIHATNNFFLSRGHLTARSDFFYPSQQNSTFYFINAAPQWQTFNGFNWDTAETDVQNYASNNGVDLLVWTGTHGIATLPHETTGRQVNLHIFNANNTQGIPVPAIYWKVVYNPISRRGIALIGVNNPYQTDVSPFIFCDDRSDFVTWLTWRKTDIQRGYSYACTVTAFRRIVRTVPDLDINGLLF